MVLAYHAIFTAYGFWLPNDPRGSWSDFVASWEIFRFGKAVHPDTRASVAHRPHDVARRLAAKKALQFPPVLFSGTQALACIQGFAQAVRKSHYTLYACAILPDHVHMVVARHRQKIEAIVGHLKSAATAALYRDRLHPFMDQYRPTGEPVSCWAERSWSVYLNSPSDIVRAIAYVEGNPLKEGHKPQHWSFVTPYPPRDPSTGSANQDR